MSNDPSNTEKTYQVVLTEEQASSIYDTIRTGMCHFSSNPNGPDNSCVFCDVQGEEDHASDCPGEQALKLLSNLRECL